MAEKILFIDRDGTLIEEPHDNQVDALEKIRLVKGVIPALLSLRDAGYIFVMVSNQDGLGTSAFPTEDFTPAHQHVLDIFSSQGITFDEVFICPHTAEDQCECRKPRTGLLTAYLASHQLDLEASAVIGDRDTDIEMADKIGIQGFRIPDLNWAQIENALCSRHRVAVVSRKTRETDIAARVNLDADQPISLDSGIGFFDHMLEQLAKHGGFSLSVSCDGDLHIDEHHTVEDVAICIGGAMRQALGNKAGVGRYGFLLPMDESDAQVSIDLSGRANFRFEGAFGREAVGGLPTELVPHFFQSLAESLGAAIHIEVNGENAHHMVEAVFKSVGRAIRPAIKFEGGAPPSTKGMLA